MIVNSLVHTQSNLIIILSTIIHIYSIPTAPFYSKNDVPDGESRNLAFITERIYAVIHFANERGVKLQ